MCINKYILILLPFLLHIYVDTHTYVHTALTEYIKILLFVSGCT